MKTWSWIAIGIGTGILVGVISIGVWGELGQRAKGNEQRGGATPISFVQHATSSMAGSTGEEVDEMAVTPTQTFVDDAFAAKEALSVSSGARILLIPHHLVAAKQIASLLTSVHAPKRVILLTPDHLGVGKGVVTIGDATIAIGDQQVRGDAKIASRISSAVSGSAISTPSISKELAMQALIPFVQRAWPNATIIPVIVHANQIAAGSDARDHLRVQLAQIITSLLNEDQETMLVASVDFSHYLPAFVADFHDELATDVVSSLSDREADRVELDNPDVLAVALKTARTLGLGDVTIHAHTNSLRLLQSTLSNESTSHVIASFAPGVIAPERKTTILFLGDVMLDRTVRTRMQKSKVLDFPFDQIEGQEDRFFKGQDLVVANLEGPVTSQRLPPEKSIDFAFDPSVVPLLKKVGIDAVSQANNHSLDQGRTGADDSRAAIKKGGIAVFGDQVRDEASSSLAVVESRGVRIALLGFNDSDRPVDREKASAAITEAKSKADRVVVMMHWGSEYQLNPNARQTDLAHWLVDQGVDAVIGGHPHWMESVEQYKGRFIAYSLGNFVFDQDWSAETQEGLAIGLVIDSTSTEAYLYPIHIGASEPRVLTGDVRTARLERLP